MIKNSYYFFYYEVINIHTVYKELILKIEKNKYYAVKKGHKKGIYNNWEECKKQIYNYPNAEYKKFNTLDLAKKYITNNETNSKLLQYECIAYTDGSFDKLQNTFTYGAVIIYNKKRYCFYEKYNDKNWIKMRNVAGEIMGVIKVVKFCEINNIRNILIFHDYTGLAKWAKNEWKTSTQETKMYQDYLNNASKIVKVDFQWVKSHSNDKYNEMADNLASKAYKLKVFSKIIL